MRAEDQPLVDGGEIRRRPSGDSSELTDDQLWYSITNDAAWLFYGELDAIFPGFMRQVFAELEENEHGGNPSFDRLGFGMTPMTPDFAVAFWLFLSELVRLNLAEYGTSPRGAWLTEDGKRFRRMVTERTTLEWRPEWPEPT